MSNEEIKDPETGEEKSELETGTMDATDTPEKEEEAEDKEEVEEGETEDEE